MNKQIKLSIILACLCAFLFLTFNLIFTLDNKYTSPGPYGNEGVIKISQSNLEQKRPIYLIDGWLLSDKNTAAKTTYIGEFSNLQRNNPSISPHGVAQYQLCIKYFGQPMAVSISFHELFSSYTIKVNDITLSTGNGNALASFMLTPGDNLLTVTTTSHHGFYSGMYFPPALGIQANLSRVDNIKTFAYSVAFLSPLVLALFTLNLWRLSKSKINLWFGILCLSFALYISYYFAHLFSLPILSIWYFIEELSLYLMIFCVLKLSLISSKWENGFLPRHLGRIFTIFPAALSILYFAIPYINMSVIVHGRLKNLYFIIAFLASLILSIHSIREKSAEYPYILAGNFIFSVGLLVNLISSNQFEPIYFFWQFEWCALILVLLFASMMVARNHRILQENQLFESHLEGLVARRTDELTALLQERREFFSHMAHDLKAPLFATQSFIDAIRSNSIALDDDLIYYINQVESKQFEMAKRVQSLNTLNKLDKIVAPKVRISVWQLLDELYTSHSPESEVSAIHFIVVKPLSDCFVLAQTEKLLMVFENLVYNSIRATPMNGKITITAKVSGGQVVFTVEDTGCGIGEKELPLIFKRFFVGEQNKETGSGLGLYIVKSIIDELNGDIYVSSTLNIGTRFTISLPLSP